ncbi:hypothetical protein H4R18_000431 [Coemansia javaensis]|uniref:Uncharacterized protein n=1 Tax=Coemansia javaensis TaxID=2761396 RepID=A0A9W8LKL9_9FUNG|nr:hypothetical protein H4R18_000431 [Coemansia javaensis]
MRTRVVRVLRLGVQLPAAAQAAPGLGLVFAACPLCSHKAERRAAPHGGAAGGPQQQQQAVWVCRHCRSEVGGGDVEWTYRITASVAGAGGAAEATASVLGAAAECWFGCPAAQWVRETGGALQALARRHPGASSATLLAHMADRLAALADMAAGIAGDYVLADLRWAPAAARARRTPQCSISRIRPVDGAAGGPVGLIRLWRAAVYEALSAGHGGQPGDDADLERLLQTLEADTRPLRLADGLAAPCSVAEFAPEAGGSAQPDGEAPAVDDAAVLAAWADACGRRAEAAAPDVVVVHSTQGSDCAQSSGGGGGGLGDIADSDIDALLSGISQPLALGCSAPLAGVLGGDDPLSAQQFEESVRDEHAHSLLLGSQLSPGLLLSQFSLRGLLEPPGGPDASQPASLASPVRVPALLPHTPPSTLRRRLETSPAPAASLGSCPSTPAWPPSAQASQPTPPEDGAPVVLAEETPTAQSHRPKRRLDLCVPETPLPVRGSTRLAAGAASPSLRRAASASGVGAVPETPAPNPRRAKAARPRAAPRAHERFRPLAMAGSSQLSQTRRARRGAGAALRPPLLRLCRSTSVEEADASSPLG